MDRLETSLSNLEFIERREPQDTFIEDVGYQSLLEREVIFRRLTPIASGNPRLRYRFIQEGRLLASLRHPNLIEVYDAGIDENNCVYLLLEKPAGISLQQRLNLLNGQRGSIDREEIMRIMIDVANGVEQVHQHNALVLDVSPTNIVLTSDGRAVLTGLGQPLPEEVLAASSTALAYAAPERIAGGQVDQRSDIYSLGVLLYHLLFGRLPFEGSVLGIVGQKQQAAPLPGLDGDHPAPPCSPALAQVIRRATAQDIKRRYENVAAFRTALIHALSGESVEELKVALVPARSYEGTNGHNGHNGHNGSNGHNGHNGYHGSNGHNGYHDRNGHRGGVSLNGLTGADILSASLPLITLTGNQPAGLNGKTAAARSSSVPPVPAAPEVDRAREPEIPEAAPDAAAAAEPAGTLADEISPLMPGHNNPALQAAIPFTTLVPMPAPAEAAITPAAPQVEPLRTTLVRPWMVWIGMLGLLAAFAALKLG